MIVPLNLVDEFGGECKLGLAVASSPQGITNLVLGGLSTNGTTLTNIRSVELLSTPAEVVAELRRACDQLEKMIIATGATANPGGDKLRNVADRIQQHGTLRPGAPI